MFDMKQILVRLSPALARSLERIAPGRGRKRSEFVRRAIIKAIMEADDARAAESYRRWPQESIAIDPSDWVPESEAIHPTDEDVRDPARSAGTRRRAPLHVRPRRTSRARRRRK